LSVITASWQIVVARTTDDVFSYVADLNNEPRWNPDASNVVQKSPGGIGHGTSSRKIFSSRRP
jgi:hypothetical protein